MKIKFLKLAKLEFDEEIAYYNSESEGLGKRFKNEIRSSIDIPELYPVFSDDIRKCVTYTFPYTIFYTYKNETIYIYAIANHYKDPLIYAKRFIEKG